MLERNTILLTTPNGVAAGGTATFKIPQMYRVHGLKIVYGGNLADYPEMRVKANTSVIRRCSFTEQDMMNQTDKAASAATLGYLYVPFDKIGCRTHDGETETALNIGRPPGAQPQPNEITSCEVQVDIDAGAASPSLTIYAVVSPAIMGGAGIVRHIVKTSRYAGGAGEIDIQDLDFNKPNRQFLRRWFAKTTNIDHIKIKRDDRLVFDLPTTLNSASYKEQNYRVEQAGWTLWDASRDGYGGEALNLNGVQSFLLQLDFTAATPSFPLILEYYGALVG